MNTQLSINFPNFTQEMFFIIRQKYALLDEVKKDKEIEHLKHVIAGYKSWRTKRNKTKK